MQTCVYSTLSRQKMVDQNAETYITKFTAQWFHYVSMLKSDELEVSEEGLKSSIR